MGKLGRAYTRADYNIRTGQNTPAANQQLDQSLTQGDDAVIRHKITARVVRVICVLGFFFALALFLAAGFLGWILTP